MSPYQLLLHFSDIATETRVCVAPSFLIFGPEFKFDKVSHLPLKFFRLKM